MHDNNLKNFILPMLEAREMSVEQFARACGVTRAMMYFYFEDRHRPSGKVAVLMSQVLGVAYEELSQQFKPNKRGRTAKNKS